MAFLRHAWAVAWKDLRVELRTREILSLSSSETKSVLLLGFSPRSAGSLLSKGSKVPLPNPEPLRLAVNRLDP